MRIANISGDVHSSVVGVTLGSRPLLRILGQHVSSVRHLHIRRIPKCTSIPAQFPQWRSHSLFEFSGCWRAKHVSVSPTSARANSRSLTSPICCALRCDFCPIRRGIRRYNTMVNDRFGNRGALQRTISGHEGCVVLDTIGVLSAASVVSAVEFI